MRAECISESIYKHYYFNENGWTYVVFYVSFNHAPLGVQVRLLWLTGIWLIVFLMARLRFDANINQPKSWHWEAKINLVRLFFFFLSGVYVCGRLTIAIYRHDGGVAAFLPLVFIYFIHSFIKLNFLYQKGATQSFTEIIKERRKQKRKKENETRNRQEDSGRTRQVTGIRYLCLASVYVFEHWR